MLENKDLGIKEKIRKFLDDFYEKKWFDMYATDVVSGNIPEVKCDNSDLIKTVLIWSDSREPMTTFLSFCKKIGINLPIEISSSQLVGNYETWIHIKEVETNKDWCIFLGTSLLENGEVEHFFKEKDFEDEYIYNDMTIQIHIADYGFSLLVKKQDMILVNLKIMGGKKCDSSLYTMYLQIKEKMMRLLKTADYDINIQKYIKLLMPFYNVLDLIVWTENEKVVLKGTKLCNYNAANDELIIKVFAEHVYAECVVEGTKIIFGKDNIKIYNICSSKQAQQLIDLAQSRIEEKIRDFTFEV